MKIDYDNEDPDVLLERVMEVIEQSEKYKGKE
jgi:hypothetical protein